MRATVWLRTIGCDRDGDEPHLSDRGGRDDGCESDLVPCLPVSSEYLSRLDLFLLVRLRTADGLNHWRWGYSSHWRRNACGRRRRSGRTGRLTHLTPGPYPWFVRCAHREGVPRIGNDFTFLGWVLASYGREVEEGQTRGWCWVPVLWQKVGRDERAVERCGTGDVWRCLG